MSSALPPDVVRNIVEIFGARGERWLGELPAVLRGLCATWGLVQVGAPMTGGTHSWVAPVRRADGSLAVLKIPVRDPENAGEAAGLHWYGGDGAVRLYDFDPGSGALLLEYARPGTPLLPQPETPLEGLPENAGRVRLACDLLRRLRRAPGELPDGYPPLPTVADVVAEWSAWLTGPAAAVLDPPLRSRARDRCAELAEPDGPLLVVNRDNHLGNIVAAEREPLLLIDPKPYLGEAAFDAGFLVLIQVASAPGADQARRVTTRTADALGVGARRARSWAFLRAVEEVAWAVEDDRPADRDRNLAIAAALR
ncbi:aminoglycoside phosphotransferase family protein [Nocardia sp. NPDC057227]|uniref:aminoglycoside phosphotransferase family protein n=1 Tax=Nocardia sp. NPDC057227 TaxID=3346056 RepID=UPI00363BE6ED